MDVFVTCHLTGHFPLISHDFGWVCGLTDNITGLQLVRRFMNNTLVYKSCPGCFEPKIIKFSDNTATIKLNEFLLNQ